MSAAVKPILQPDREAMLRHLTWIAAPAVDANPELRLEIAWGEPNRGPSQARTFQLDDLNTAADLAERVNRGGSNVYVGVTLKRGDTPVSGRTRSEHASVATCLAIDFDAALQDGIRKLETIARPALLIMTGTRPKARGQVWIRLKRTPEMDAWNELNSNSVALADADRNAIGSYRLMRLGGSVSIPSSVKRERGYCVELTIVKIRTAPCYDASELLRGLPRIEGLKTTAQQIGLKLSNDGLGAIKRKGDVSGLEPNIRSKAIQPPPMETMRAALRHLAATNSFEHRSTVVTGANGRITKIGWVQCGMALKSAYGPAGFLLWDITHRDEQARRDAFAQWKSFASEALPGHITIGTIIKAARQAGMQDLVRVPRRRRRR